ncbi:MAG: roadblock/LC7 domain-containing protein [Candidatus Thermoplasmatota archaeon]
MVPDLAEIPLPHAVRRKTSLTDRLVGVLEEFEEGIPEVRGSAIADREGLPIANGFREPLDLMSITAMSTLAVASSRKVFDRLGLKTPRSMVIEGDEGKVVVQELGGGEASFITLVRPETNMGLLKLEMGVAARRIEEELGFTERSGARVEEVFVVSNAGLLIGHLSRSGDGAQDYDIVAGMLSAVQSFVKDVFRETGDTLEEMELAHRRVRLIRGSWCLLAVVASGPITDRFLSIAYDLLRAFEERNDVVLDAWDGDLDALHDVDALLEELINRQPN